MYYTVYRVTNQISGKFYIGTHRTKDLNDGYMGSGKYLKRAIEKHGLDNFTKEILFVFDNPDQMFSKEAEIVNEDFLSEENTYNIKIGGMGGFDYLNSSGKNLYGKNGLLGFGGENLKPNKPTEISRKKISNSIKLLYKNGFLGGFAGKKHKEEAKKILSDKAKKRMIDPTKNSQYGSMWITNGKENKKIKKVDFIPEGWYKGRKISIADVA